MLSFKTKQNIIAIILMTKKIEGEANDYLLGFDERTVEERETL